MEFLRDILTSPYRKNGKIIRSKHIEDVDGNAPAVVFDDAGNEITIVLTRMDISLSSDVIMFSFEELEADNSGVLKSVGQRSVYSKNTKVVDLITGLSHRLDESEHYEDGEIKPGYQLEYDYHISLFGKNSNTPFSVFDMIRSYIKIRFNEGLAQDRVTESEVLEG